MRQAAELLQKSMEESYDTSLCRERKSNTCSAKGFARMSRCQTFGIVIAPESELEERFMFIFLSNSDQNKPNLKPERAQGSKVTYQW